MNRVLLPLLLLSFFFIVSGFVFQNTQLHPLEINTIKFNIAGPLGKVNGSIAGLRADILFTPQTLNLASFTATLPVSGLQTGIKKRDEHLMSPEYFDEKRYPTIIFSSIKVDTLYGKYQLSGDLEIKGIKKPVLIPFVFSEEGNTSRFVGEFEIDRTDFEVGKKSMLMGEKVKIRLDVPCR